MKRTLEGSVLVVALASACSAPQTPAWEPTPIYVPPPSYVPPPAPAPAPRPAGRTYCSLTGLYGDGTRVTPRTVPVDESICTNSNAGGESPGAWLHYCRNVSSGATNCAASSMSATPYCVATVIGGRSRAACCPANATMATDPRCISADTLHPPGPND